MGYVITLKAFLPPEREDGVPFTHAQIEEAANPLLDGTVIDDVVLSPVDSDPAHPAARSFTTANAVLAAAWYRPVFLDAFDNKAPGEWVGASGTGIILPPSADDVRSRSKLLQLRFPESPLDAQVERDLRELVMDTTALVEALTCRTLDASLGADPVLSRLAMRAIVLKAERMGERSYSAKASRKAITSTNLRSISAGPWSESYFGPEDTVTLKALDPDPMLNEVLWNLTTPECQDRYRELWGLPSRPGAAVQQFDRGRSARSYSRGSRIRRL